MVHDKSTYVVVKGHEQEFSHAIVVDNPCCLVCECSKAKNVGVWFVVHTIYEVEALFAFPSREVCWLMGQSHP